MSSTTTRQYLTRDISKIKIHHTTCDVCGTYLVNAKRNNKKKYINDAIDSALLHSFRFCQRNWWGRCSSSTNLNVLNGNYIHLCARLCSRHARANLDVGRVIVRRHIGRLADGTNEWIVKAFEIYSIDSNILSVVSPFTSNLSGSNWPTQSMNATRAQQKPIIHIKCQWETLWQWLSI